MAQVLERGKAEVERGVLEDDSDPPTDGCRIPPHVRAEHTRSTAGRMEKGRQNLERGRLASSVRTQEPEQLARAHGERYVVESRSLPVPDLEALDLDRRRIGRLQIGARSATSRARSSGRYVTEASSTRRASFPRRRTAIMRPAPRNASPRTSAPKK